MKYPVYAILFLTLLLSPGAWADLPELGDPTLQNFTTRDEARLGQAFYHTLRASLVFVDDLQVQYYIQSLGQRLASHSTVAGKKFHFFIVDSSQINAFAGPDAYIGINSGTILAAQNESELAGVMAHEIGHIAQRHLAREISNSGKSTAATLATLIAAILVGSQDSQAGEAALLAGIAGTQQASLNTSRRHEAEADRIGIEILTRAGINPEGMVNFFQILLSRNPGNDLEYLQTHPLTQNRIAEARNRVTAAEARLPSDSEDFQFAKARVAVLVSDQPEDFLTKDAVPDDVYGRYEKALAEIKAQRPELAVPILKSLLRKHSHPWIKLALAKAYENQNQSKKALKILAELNSFYPDYLPVTLRYAEALTANHQPEKSIILLKQQLQSDDDAIVMQQLARAYFANGQTAAALETTGNQYLSEGYLELASQQYQNALSQPNLNESSRQRLIAKKEQLKEKLREKIQ